MSAKIGFEVVAVTLVLFISTTVICTTPSSQFKVRGHESVKMYSSPASFSGQIQSERHADYGYVYLPTVNRYIVTYFFFFLHHFTALKKSAHQQTIK